MNPEEIISRRIRQARGEEEADLVIKKAAVFYLSSGELRRGDIAVCGDTIVGVDDSYHGKIEFDASGLTAVPGFIDSHVHIESTCLTPWEYERAVLPHGVTSAVCDPHELANVAGAEALKYFSDCASGMIMDLRIRFSSCVPASPWESPGARLSAESLRSAAGLPHLEGLAEVMDFPGVLACKEDLLDKLSKKGEEKLVREGSIRFSSYQYLTCKPMRLRPASDTEDELCVELDNYVLLSPDNIPLDDRDKARLQQVLARDPLALIEYWSIDPDYDGHTFRSRWQDYRENTGNDNDALHCVYRTTLRVPRLPQRTVCVKAVDVFGFESIVTSILPQA